MPLPPGSTYTRQKRLMLTPEDDAAIERLANRVAEVMGTPVKFSHILRACIRILHHAQDDVLQQAERSRLHRPPNEKPEALSEFEGRLARTLLVAFKKTSHMR